MSADWYIRTARRGDAGPVGELLARTYVAAGLASPDDDYVPELRDVAGRKADANADVLVAVVSGAGGAQQLPDPRGRAAAEATGTAVGTATGAVIGTVTRCGYGSPLTTMCQPGEFEFRMLGVDPAWRGYGIAAALVNACDYFGALDGQTLSLGCAWEGNTAAQALYSKIGFDHVNDRDWFYSPEEFLYVYSRRVANCPLCGQAMPEGGHPGCQRALALEPPRYCATCARRLKVQVMPYGWSATCSRHGTIVG